MSELDTYVGPVWATWNGGSSYSPGTVDDDLERFPNMDTAKAEFMSRYHSGRCNTWYYVDKPNDGSDTPAVDEQTEMFVYFYDPRTAEPGDEPYPDAIMRLGLDGEHALVEHC